MKGCASWNEAIADCALGKTPEPDLAAHLAICPHCERALRDSEKAVARIDGALRRARAVEPPLYGPERVMARIRGQADTGGWWRLAGWRWAMGGCAVAALLIATVLWVRRPKPEPDVTALSAWRSPTQSLLRPPVAAAWTTTPRLGEGYFKIKTLGEIHAQ
jgi:hypothetical protein